MVPKPVGMIDHPIVFGMKRNVIKYHIAVDLIMHVNKVIVDLHKDSLLQVVNHHVNKGMLVLYKLLKYGHRQLQEL